MRCGCGSRVSRKRSDKYAIDKNARGLPVRGTSVSSPTVPGNCVQFGRLGSNGASSRLSIRSGLSSIRNIACGASRSRIYSLTPGAVTILWPVPIQARCIARPARSNCAGRRNRVVPDSRRSATSRTSGKTRICASIVGHAWQRRGKVGRVLGGWSHIRARATVSPSNQRFTMA
jgi:hypothetical protein